MKADVCYKQAQYEDLLVTYMGSVYRSSPVFDQSRLRSKGYENFIKTAKDRSRPV